MGAFSVTLFLVFLAVVVHFVVQGTIDRQNKQNKPKILG